MKFKLIFTSSSIFLKTIFGILTPKSLNIIEKTKTNYGQSLTVIGSGGVFSPHDAQEKLDKGADLIQLITGMIYEGPGLINRINHKLLSK